MTEHEGDGRTKRRDLRQRQIDENDFARKYLDAEISVDADKTNRHQERRPEKCERLNHLIAAADAGPQHWCRTARCNRRSSAARRPKRPASRSMLRPCPPQRPRRASGSCGSRTTIRTSRARMVRIIPARCEGLGGTPGFSLDKADKIQTEAARKIGPAVVIGDNRNGFKRRELASHSASLASRRARKAARLAS